MSNDETTEAATEEAIAEDGAGDAPPEPAAPEVPADDEADSDAAEQFSREYVEKLRKESAGYRDRAKAAEAAVTALQRQQVESHAAAAGLKSAALWATTELADVLDPESGAVDFGQVNTAIKAARESLGIPKNAPITRGGLSSGSGVPQETPKGFAAAFAPPER